MIIMAISRFRFNFKNAIASLDEFSKLLVDIKKENGNARIDMSEENYVEYNNMSENFEKLRYERFYFAEQMTEILDNIFCIRKNREDLRKLNEICFLVLT